MKSELAIARDAWLESPEGRACTDLESMQCYKNPRSGEIYLKNRIERAFLAGAKAMESINTPLEPR